MGNRCPREQKRGKLAQHPSSPRELSIAASMLALLAVWHNYRVAAYTKEKARACVLVCKTSHLTLSAALGYPSSELLSMQELPVEERPAA